MRFAGDRTGNDRLADYRQNDQRGWAKRSTSSLPQPLNTKPLDYLVVEQFLQVGLVLQGPEQFQRPVTLLCGK